jgi:hypothetical protein
LIKDVRKEDDPDAVEYAGTNGIPHWGVIISHLAKSSWAHDLKQILATVIDSGIFKDVPYVSFRCATSGYEVNIYGDLDRPAGIEIGTLNYLLRDNTAKSNCIEFISNVLMRAEDVRVVRALRWNQKELVETNGMTFEITLPKEADAYGGWWVSVYDQKALEKAKASGPELLAITEPRTPPPRTIRLAPVARPVTWSSEEIAVSRMPRYSQPTGNTGGRVFVRGYYRKNGTYVHSYSRRSPRRH